MSRLLLGACLRRPVLGPMFGNGRQFSQRRKEEMVTGGGGFMEKYYESGTDSESDDDIWNDTWDDEMTELLCKKQGKEKVFQTVASFGRICIADRPVCPSYMTTPQTAASGLLTHFNGYTDNPQDYVRFGNSTVAVETSYHLTKHNFIRSPVYESNGFFIGHGSWKSTKYVACTFHSISDQIDENDNSCDNNGLYLSDDTFVVEQSTVGMKWNRDLILVWSPDWVDPTSKRQAKVVYFNVEKDIALLEIENYESDTFMEIGEFDRDPQNVVGVARRLFRIKPNQKGFYDAHGKLLRQGVIRKMFGEYLQCSLMGLKKGNISKDVLPLLCEKQGMNYYNGKLFGVNKSPFSHCYDHYLSTLPTYSGFGLSTKPGQVSAIHTGGFVTNTKLENNQCSAIEDSFECFIKPDKSTIKV